MPMRTVLDWDQAILAVQKVEHSVLAMGEKPKSEVTYF